MSRDQRKWSLAIVIKQEKQGPNVQGYFLPQIQNLRKNLMLHFLFKYSRDLFIIRVHRWKCIAQIPFKGTLDAQLWEMQSADSPKCQVPQDQPQLGRPASSQITPFPGQLAPRSWTRHVCKCQAMFCQRGESGYIPIPFTSCIQTPSQGLLLESDNLRQRPKFYIWLELFSMVCQINEYPFLNCKPTKSFLISQTQAIFCKFFQSTSYILNLFQNKTVEE